MTTKAETVSIATLRKGAAIELIDDALEEVFANIADPNTDPEELRRVILSIKLKPDRKRENVHLDVSVATKKAQPVSFGAVAYLVQTRDGIVAVDADPRQPGLFEKEKPAVDPETGEVVEAEDAFGGGE